MDNLNWKSLGNLGGNQRIYELIQLQRQDGSFQLDERITVLLGLSYSFFKSLITKESETKENFVEEISIFFSKLNWKNSPSDSIISDVHVTLLVLSFIDLVFIQLKNPEELIKVLKSKNQENYSNQAKKFLNQFIQIENFLELNELMTQILDQKWINGSLTSPLVFTPHLHPQLGANLSTTSMRSKFYSFQHEWDNFLTTSDEVTANQELPINVHLHLASRTSLPLQFCNDCSRGHTVQVSEQIGKGSYGTVFRGNLWNILCAVKVFPKSFSQVDHGKFLNEADLMSKLVHKNIIQVIGVNIRPPYYLLVVEYAHFGDLFSILHHKQTKIEIPLSIKLALDISLGMEFMHQKDIIHRDLKTSNILIDLNWNAKIADFTTSCTQKKSEVFHSRTPIGTPCYMAPEVFQQTMYDRSVDVFSFSILFTELLSKKQPYSDEIDESGTWESVVPKIVLGHRPELPVTLPSLKQLIESCWNSDRLRRPSFSQIRTTLNGLHQSTSSDIYFPLVYSPIPLQEESPDTKEDEEYQLEPVVETEDPKVNQTPHNVVETEDPKVNQSSHNVMDPVSNVMDSVLPVDQTKKKTLEKVISGNKVEDFEGENDRMEIEKNPKQPSDFFFIYGTGALVLMSAAVLYFVKRMNK